MKNFNLESRRHLTEIENIFIELKKSKRKERTAVIPTEYRDTAEVELLTLRIKELENEVLRYKKYVKKLDRLETGEGRSILKAKDRRIGELGEELIVKGNLIEELENEIKEMREDELMARERVIKEVTEKHEDELMARERVIKEVTKMHEDELMARERAVKEVTEKMHEMEEMHKKDVKGLENRSDALTENLKSEILMHKRKNEQGLVDFEKERCSMEAEKGEIAGEAERLRACIAGLEEQLRDKKALEDAVAQFKRVEDGYRARVLDLQKNIQVFARIRPKRRETREMLFESLQEVEGGVRYSLGGNSLEGKSLNVNSLEGKSVTGNSVNVNSLNGNSVNGKSVNVNSVNGKSLNGARYSLEGNSLVAEHDNKRSAFEFDRILLPESDQESVFDEISGIIYGFLQGYNVCVFAYGQTGSGKTYTMLGDEASAGLIPRAVGYIFRELKGADFSLSLRILEIYNETVRNLISQESLRSREWDDEGVAVGSEEEVMRHINRSKRRRRTEATECNEFSSRSHSVYSLRLRTRGAAESTQSVLNFIDLAGSERIKVSHVEGERLKETLSINKSLLNLKIVFSAIIGREQHVPYRDSKLTYILKSSLCNKSKILMLLNVSVEDKDYNEKLCSLRFGQVASSVCVGRGHKQIVKEIE